MNPILKVLNQRPRVIPKERTREGEIHAEVEEMSNFPFNSKKMARILIRSIGIPELIINLRKLGAGQYLFNMTFLNFERVRQFSCKVLTISSIGSSEPLYECGQYTEQQTFKGWCEFPLNLDFARMEKEQQKFQSTLADDLISLYKERTLCDTTLRTESETFPAHKTVLSARSPVFKKMFTSDMKERASDYVYILDINADTLRRLLMFIYTDTVANMKWQNAMELYFAADKYQIDSLKLKCSSFLKSNVQPSNCCDLLLLSDMHQDAELKQFVQDIIKRDQDIFGSDEWRNFMANHVQLAADTMYFKYARK